MNTDRTKIIKYLNKLSKKPIKKDIDYLVKKYKITIQKNKKTKIQKYNFIKTKYKIKKQDLFHEITLKELKNIFKKNHMNIIGNKKKMFQLLKQNQTSKLQINFGFFSNIGRREYQEDRLSVYNNLYHYISCVYDGHAGNKCSSFLKNNFYSVFMKNLQNKKKPIQALFTTFFELDKQFLTNINGNDGSTANVLYCNKKNNICYLANTGDSRAILCKNNGQISQISEDHKPDNPKERKLIEQKGGFVQNGRTNGNLAMSRAFGDKNLKTVITVEPDIYQFTIRNVKFVVQASDGLFDVMSNRDICNFINSRLKNMNIQDIARDLVFHAIKNRGTQDNTSVIISLFN